MNRTYLYLSILLCLSCCSFLDVEQQENYFVSQDVLNRSDFVTFQDVKSYILNETVTKGISYDECTIESFVGTSSDTLMYILNLGPENGWKILSSDKRTPAVLAESDKGTFVLNGSNPGPYLWMLGVSKDLAIIRNLRDEDLTFSAQEIAANRSFWTGEPLRIIDPPVIDDEGGHWEITTTSSVEVYDTLGHMVPKWDQWEPYNTYCPLKTDGTGGRVPAGCVAIAGAQLLYFLNHSFGVPEYMYNNAVCEGYVGAFFQYFTSPSNTVWAYMNPNYSNLISGKEDILIALVGYLVGMEYGNDGSSANDLDLTTDVFNAMGIECSHGTYNENTVRSSLLSGMPVIVGAYSSLIPLFGWGSGHCFVIDGYKRTRTRYYHEHVWVPDNPASFYDPLNQYATYYTVSYSPLQMTGIKINWGWWTQWENNENDGWYTLTGSWHVVTNSGEHNYNYYRTMIYGFNSSN